MRIEKLDLKYVGPFQAATLDFSGAPVSVITGLNGTGKSLVLNAIQLYISANFLSKSNVLGNTILSSQFLSEIQGFNLRDIFSVGYESQGNIGFQIVHKGLFRQSYIRNLHPISLDLFRLFVENNDFIVGIWNTRDVKDSFEIPHLKAPDSSNHIMKGVFEEYKNSYTTELFTYYDYLRTSDDEFEAAIGNHFFALMERLVSECTSDTKFYGIGRRKLTPHFVSHNMKIPISNLNEGSLYLIKRFAVLLHNIFECVNKYPQFKDNIHLIPGLLLIDEPESHLHPELQKRILPTLHALFPNIQIICTTHSPFIIASAGEDAKFFVTKKDENNLPWCTVEEVTDKLVNKPIEEILISEAFNGTLPYNQEISEKLEQRREALERGDLDTATKIENELMAINPTSFAYLNIR